MNKRRMHINWRSWIRGMEISWQSCFSILIWVSEKKICSEIGHKDQTLEQIEIGRTIDQFPDIKRNLKKKSNLFQSATAKVIKACRCAGIYIQFHFIFPLLHSRNVFWTIFRFTDYDKWLVWLVSRECLLLHSI